MANFTKWGLIEDAFSVIGLASYVFALQPEDKEAALRIVDRMVASWDEYGISIGWPLPSNSEASQLTDAIDSVSTNVHDAIIYNLAKRLALKYGKTMSDEAKAIAKSTMDFLIEKAAIDNRTQMRMPSSLPRGTGNRGYRFVGDYVTPTVDAVDGPIDFD